MKKISLLLGTLGGAVAGYVFSNKKLRDELSRAKTAEDAGKVLAKHLQHDGKQIGNEVQKFVQSDTVQENIGKAKTVAQEYGRKWKHDLQSLIQKEAKALKHPAAKKAPSKKGKK